MVYVKIKLEESHDNGKTKIDDKLSNIDVLVFSVDFDLDAILLGYPSCAEGTGRLQGHRWKVEDLYFPAVERLYQAPKA